MIQVLDRGYVRCTAVTGSDLTAVNAARASFMKESQALTAGDVRLLKFLAREKHTAPFRHMTASFEVKAPLMVARQWFKYRVGWEHGPDTAELLGVAIPEEIAPVFWDFMRALAWMPAGDDEGFSDMLYARSEASRRYVTLEPEWYVPAPDAWRSAPATKKQGSGAPLSEVEGAVLTQRLHESITEGMRAYNTAMEAGVAPEQARGFLPSMYFLYTVWRWTGSLQAIAHFIVQRGINEGAQAEIHDYALAVYAALRPYFPETLAQLVTASE